MSIEWYRLYHNVPYDTKLKVIAKHSKQPITHVLSVWLCLLDAASKHDPRGIANIDAEELSVVLDIETDATAAILETLKIKNLINEKGEVVNWHKRQYTTSTERSRKSREFTQRSATRCNVRQRKNLQDTDTDTESDIDTYSDSKNINTENTEGECERGKTFLENQIAQQMLEIWNEKVQSQITPQRKATLTPKRQKLLEKRLHSNFAGDVERWKNFCDIIAGSDFYLGKIEGKNWHIDLTWAIEFSERVVKILGSNASDNNPLPCNPECCEPALQQTWEHVLQCFIKRYGYSAFKNWLTKTELSFAEVKNSHATVSILCPNKFVRDRISSLYLTDLTSWFSTHQYQSLPIKHVYLIEIGGNHDTGN